MEHKKATNRMKPIYFIETMLITSALWFLLSGIFEPRFIFFGLFSCAIISLLCINGLTFKGVKTGREYYMFHLNYFRFLIYILWLIKEIINAALYVSKLATYKYEEMTEGIVWFKADYDNPLAKALLANSITITPGTVTVDIYDNGYFSVHAISDELREGVLDGGMQHKVAAVFGENIDFKVLEITETEEMPEDFILYKAEAVSRRVKK